MFLLSSYSPAVILGRINVHLWLENCAIKIKNKNTKTSEISPRCFTVETFEDYLRYFNIHMNSEVL
jgi:hypothetical protein